ncbi:MAG: hypothetical protein QOD56_667 [Gammaproteobacteria bacterium]|jgi:hypothetical protein|nr:hypothetical protein [Gammaproteobacteria bacterium]
MHLYGSAHMGARWNATAGRLTSSPKARAGHACPALQDPPGQLGGFFYVGTSSKIGRL